MSSGNRYDNIDTCLDLLYNFMYQKEKLKECYRFNPISKSDLTLKNIKKSNEFDYAHVLSGDIEFNRKYGNRLYFTRHSDISHDCMITISEYDQRNKNVDDMERGELVDMQFMYLFSELGLVDAFPHTILPIMNFDVTMEQIKSSNKKIHDTIKKELSNIGDESIMCINVTEQFFKMVQLDKYLESKASSMTLIEWKHLLFQIFITLDRLVTKYQLGGTIFRHNDLTPESIWICEHSPPETYTTSDLQYNIPNCKFTVKLGNFRKATCEGYVHNKKSKYNNASGQYYDIFTICSHIILIIEKLGISLQPLSHFFDEIVPSKYRVTNKSKISDFDESYYETSTKDIMTNILILRKNNFFSEFIKLMESNEHNMSEGSENTPTESENNNIIGLAKPKKKKISKSSESNTKSEIAIGKKQESINKILKPKASVESSSESKEAKIKRLEKSLNELKNKKPAKEDDDEKADNDDSDSEKESKPMKRISNKKQKDDSSSSEVKEFAMKLKSFQQQQPEMSSLGLGSAMPNMQMPGMAPQMSPMMGPNPMAQMMGMPQMGGPMGQMPGMRPQIGMPSGIPQLAQLAQGPMPPPQPRMGANMQLPQLPQGMQAGMQFPSDIPMGPSLMTLAPQQGQMGGSKHSKKCESCSLTLSNGNGEVVRTFFF